MKQSQKNKFRKELTEFAKSYETRPNYIDAVRRVQGLAEWYRDLDRQNLTEEAIDAMARHHLQTHPTCLLYTSPSPRDGLLSRMPSSA